MLKINHSLIREILAVALLISWLGFAQSAYSQPNVIGLPEVEDAPPPKKLVVEETKAVKVEATEKTKKELRLGNIAGSTAGNQVDFVDTAPGGDANPISGSVSRKGAREWVMKLYNNDDKSYSVSVELVQLDAKGGKVRSDNYSYTIPAKQSRERTISVGTNVSSCSVNLKSARQLG